MNGADVLLVLGLDQATNVCGYCLMERKEEGNNIVDVGVVHIKGNSVEEKISYLKHWVIEYAEKYKPNYFVLEDIQYQNNQRTYKVLAELLGVLSNVYHENEVNYIVVPPVTWKSFFGIKGKARKEQKENTRKYIKDKFDIEVSEDEADAICIALYGCNEFS